MKRKHPFIVHINPHFRPRDPVDLVTPFVTFLVSGCALGFAIADSMNVFFTNLWTTNK